MTSLAQRQAAYEAVHQVLTAQQALTSAAGWARDAGAEGGYSLSLALAAAERGLSGLLSQAQALRDRVEEEAARKMGGKRR